MAKAYQRGFYIFMAIFVQLCTIKGLTYDENVYRGPEDVQVNAALSDVCDLNSLAEITVSWQTPNISTMNVSSYEVQHKSSGSDTWGPIPLETDVTSVVITGVKPEGLYSVSVSAIYADGTHSVGQEASLSLADLITKPLLHINLQQKLVTWKNVICDEPLFRVKQKGSSSTKWDSVETKNRGGVEFDVRDDQEHVVCFDILVNSRVFSEVCHTIPHSGNKTEPKEQTEYSYVWIVTGVVAAIVLLIAVFGLISYFLLCKQRRHIPGGQFSKQTFSSGRFGKRGVNSNDYLGVLHREQIPLNPMSRSPNCTHDKNVNRLAYASRRNSDSPDLSMDADINSEKEDD